MELEVLRRSSIQVSPSQLVADWFWWHSTAIDFSIFLIITIDPSDISTDRNSYRSLIMNPHYCVLIKVSSP